MRVYTPALTLRIGEQIAAFVQPPNVNRDSKPVNFDPVRAFHNQHDRGAIAVRGYR